MAHVAERAAAYIGISLMMGKAPPPRNNGGLRLPPSPLRATADSSADPPYDRLMQREQCLPITRPPVPSRTLPRAFSIAHQDVFGPP